MNYDTHPRQYATLFNTTDGHDVSRDVIEIIATTADQ